MSLAEVFQLLSQYGGRQNYASGLTPMPAGSGYDLNTFMNTVRPGMTPQSTPTYDQTARDASPGGGPTPPADLWDIRSRLAPGMNYGQGPRK